MSNHRMDLVSFPFASNIVRVTLRLFPCLQSSAVSRTAVEELRMNFARCGSLPPVELSDWKEHRRQEGAPWARRYLAAVPVLRALWLQWCISLCN